MDIAEKPEKIEKIVGGVFPGECRVIVYTSLVPNHGAEEPVDASAKSQVPVRQTNGSPPSLSVSLRGSARHALNKGESLPS